MDQGIIFSLHTPEQLRQLSNYAHWAEGTIFLAVTFVLFSQFLGLIKEKKAQIVCSSLVLFAGIFLLAFVFLHHSLNQAGLVLQVMVTDPQQRQHSIMAVLLIIASSVQLLFTFQKIKGKIWYYVFPCVLAIIGLLFLFHPQHGTVEAVSYMKPYHTFLGIVLLLAALCTWLSLLKNKQKLFYIAAIFFLFLSSLLLLFYREPEGSYVVTPDMGNQMLEGTMKTETSSDTMSHGGPVTDYVSFIDMLRSMGKDVKPAGEITQEFFSVSGNAVAVNGEQIQVFEYPSSNEANMDSKKVSPDGSSIGTTMVMWAEPAHFYQKERIIVLYVGKNQETISLLDSILGRQFAGS